MLVDDVEVAMRRHGTADRWAIVFKFFGHFFPAGVRRQASNKAPWQRS